MTERIAEIEARLKEATPGPWDRASCGGVVQHYDLAVKTGENSSEREGIVPGEYVREDDAEFIAHAPEDIAYLLAELRKRV